jgi:SAM-dependent methyltransferase
LKDSKKPSELQSRPFRTKLHKSLAIIEWYLKPVNVVKKLLSRKGYYVYYVKLTDRDVPSFDGLSFKSYGHSSWLRVPMYNLIDDFLKANIGERYGSGKKAIELGGSEGTLKSIVEGIGYQVEIAKNYPEVDAHHLPYADDSFDVVLLDQVLEHVASPWLAVDEAWRVLKIGGLAIATVPFILQYHADSGWKDYWRFTPDGLSSLFQDFEILTSAGWGNGDAVRAMYNQDVVSIHNTPLSIAVEKKLFEKPNDGLNFIMTWVIAKKAHSGNRIRD